MSTAFSIFNTRNASDANAPTLVGVSVSGTPTIYSELIAGLDADGAGVTFFTTGTLTGTWTAWVTDKPNPGLADDSDWVQDTLFVPTNPAGAASKFRDDTGNSKGYHKRFKYVNASGTGTIQAFATVPKYWG